MKNGSATIHDAAGYGDLEVVKSLLVTGANVHATNDVSGEGRGILDCKNDTHVPNNVATQFFLKLWALPCLQGETAESASIFHSTPFITISCDVSWPLFRSSLVSGQAHLTSRGGAQWVYGGGEGIAGGRRERPRNGYGEWE